MGVTGGLLDGGLLRQAERARENRENYDPELPTYEGGALGSFKKGLVTLPKTVASKLGERVRTGWKVESVAKEADGRYLVSFETPQGAKQVLRPPLRDSMA
jgi:oxygen-dependent protoporphyrinogen oxidase